VWLCKRLHTIKYALKFQATQEFVYQTDPLRSVSSSACVVMQRVTKLLKGWPDKVFEHMGFARPFMYGVYTVLLAGITADTRSNTVIM